MHLDCAAYTRRVGGDPPICRRSVRDAPSLARKLHRALADAFPWAAPRVPLLRFTGTTFDHDPVV